MYSLNESGQMTPVETEHVAQITGILEDDRVRTHGRTLLDGNNLFVRLGVRIKEWYQTAGSKTYVPMIHID